MEALDRHIQNIKQAVLNVRLPAGLFSDPYSFVNRVKFRPLTKNNVLFYYMPLQGVVNYSVLSVNVMNPSYFTRLFPRRDITNLLLFNTFIGTSLWLWHRPHLQGVAIGRRLPWVSVASVLHVLGSVLMWAMLRSSCGRRPGLTVPLGLVTGAAITYSAYDYFRFLDKDLDPIDYPATAMVRINDDKMYEDDME